MNTVIRPFIGQLAGWTGRQTLRILLHWMDLVTFTVQALSVWRPHRNISNHATYSALLNQMIFTGVDAVPVFTLLALTIGMGITTQMIFLMYTVGNVQDVVNMLSQVVATELGPLITAIILIGRSGSAITVDLGNMKVNGELSALELLGIDIDDIFVVPRIISTTISQVTLSVYFSFITLISGIALSEYLFGISSLEYINTLISALSPKDVLIFFLKNLLFGVIIGATACFHALKVQGSITEVPQRTQRAIVQSIALVFLTDAFMVLVVL